MTTTLKIIMIFINNFQIRSQNNILSYNNLFVIYFKTFQYIIFNFNKSKTTSETKIYMIV